MHLGVGDRYYSHGLQLVLVGVQREVDVNFFGGGCSNMALLVGENSCCV